MACEYVQAMIWHPALTFRFSTDILCYRQPWREALMASPAAHHPPPVISVNPFPSLLTLLQTDFIPVLLLVPLQDFFLVQMWGDILSSLNFGIV